MRPEVERWATEDSETIDLIRRCWNGEHRPGDSDALSAWVTRTVLRGWPRFEGARPGKRVLDHGQREAIRDLYALGGVTQAQLADRFGVSSQTIFNVIHHRYG